MMRSLYSGVSGIKSHNTRMDVIGNNIANVNTTGFKSSRVTFADTLNQTLTGAASPQGNIGGVNAKQIGLGVAVASIDNIMTDGSVQNTGKNTDLALSGDGMFVVKRGQQTYYTRDGAFEFDAEGNYVLPGSGLYVQGWMGENGVVNTTGMVTNINIPSGKGMNAEATSMITYSNNLDSSTLMITGITDTTGSSSGLLTYDGRVIATANSPLILSLSDGSTRTVSTGSYVDGHSLPITTETTVYDSLGNAYSIPVLLEMETKGTMATPPTGNDWTMSLVPMATATSSGVSYSYDFVTDSGITVSPSLAVASSNSIAIKFNTDGVYISPTAASGSVIPTLGITLMSSGAYTTQTVNFNFDRTTQYAGNNTINPANDGHAAGTLTGVSIDSSGQIVGTYSNDVRQVEAQIAVAQFNNSSGLLKTSNSLYQESNNSGTANIKTASDLGVSITGSSLEMSNVDVANEFSEMIITQRGFQANSKIVTVGDEMLETLINMKR